MYISRPPCGDACCDDGGSGGGRDDGRDGGDGMGDLGGSDGGGGTAHQPQWETVLACSSVAAPQIVEDRLLPANALPHPQRDPESSGGRGPVASAPPPLCEAAVGGSPGWPDQPSSSSAVRFRTGAKAIRLTPPSEARQGSTPPSEAQHEGPVVFKAAGGPPSGACSQERATAGSNQGGGVSEDGGAEAGGGGGAASAAQHCHEVVRIAVPEAWDVEAGAQEVGAARRKPGKV